MMRTQTRPTMTDDSLDRLLALLDAARADEARRPRVDLPTAHRRLLAAIDCIDTTEASARHCLALRPLPAVASEGGRARA
jgi:hypothetical protein